MKFIQLAPILALMAGVSVSSANEQESPDRLSDPKGLASILHLDGWQVGDDPDRVAVGQIPGLISSIEITTDDKSRIVLMIFEKGEKSSEGIGKSLIATFASKSDAFAIRAATRAKIDRLKSVVFHAVHSKGKILLESYVSVIDGDQYIYAMHGMCSVNIAEKRGKEILEMIKSFRRPHRGGDKKVTEDGAGQAPPRPESK